MNADEYISRKKAVDACFDGWNNTPHDCAENIRQLPAADVRPVARGYWHGEGDGYADGELVCDMWQCSCCGEWFDEWDDKPTWNYCPNCGADMRGTNDEKA